jgi:hypothetical protein
VIFPGPGDLALMKNMINLSLRRRDLFSNANSKPRPKKGTRSGKWEYIVGSGTDT